MRLPTLRTFAPVALATLVSPALHACTQASGGAVEVSWNLYDESGSTIKDACTTANVGQIELRWAVTDDAGHVETRSTSFACDDDHGVTGFDIKPGQASLWLAPVCSTGVVGTFSAPAPIVRTITAGDVVTLDAQIIQVKTQGCTTQEPCTCR